MEEIRTNIDKLREVALDQHGYVTTAQALAVGVTRPALSMLVRRGRIERADTMVYRVPQVPEGQYGRLQLALLWTGRDDAALSGQTALDAWGICDIYSDEIHVSVPKGARIRRSGGDGVVVHYENLSANQLTWWELMRIVTPAVAIRQCIEIGVRSHLIDQAISGAIDCALIDDEGTEQLRAMLERRTHDAG